MQWGQATKAALFELVLLFIYHIPLPGFSFRGVKALERLTIVGEVGLAWPTVEYALSQMK